MPKILMPHSGQGGELRELLVEALGIPPRAKSFSVHFDTGQPLTVSCVYFPTEQPEPPAGPDDGLPRVGASLDDR